jgi:hypothetical protein
MKNPILFLLLLVCCKEEKEPPPEDREFMLQFIDTQARTGNVLYYNSYYDTVKVPSSHNQNVLINVIKSGEIREYRGGLYTNKTYHRISLSSKEIKKLSERVNFENMDYWKKTYLQTVRN